MPATEDDRPALDDDTWARAVYLDCQSGLNSERIAEKRRLTVADVERLLERGTQLVEAALRDPKVVAEIRAKVAAAEANAKSRRPESARELLSSAAILSVEPPEPGTGDADWLVTFADIPAHDFSDLIDLTEARLRDLAGVASAIREDREVIVVVGSVGGATLHSIIADWWVQWLSELGGGK